jgi:hypothetical protein
MLSNDYHFITHWQIEGTVEEVSKILEDTASLLRWWPSVYLELQVLDPGDEIGRGKVVRLKTKGWLPYTLNWQFRIIESRRPCGFSLEAWGDFVGRGIWSFKQDGPRVNITYDWRILAEKPLLRWLSFLVKPVFSANHRWAMAQGEKSLRLELARRRANSAEELARIPAPPGLSMSLSYFALLATATILVLGCLAGVLPGGKLTA